MPSQATLHLATASLTLLLAVAALHVLPQPAICRPRRAYVLLVALQLDPAKGGFEALARAWEPLARAVRALEPDCLSYELCRDAEDENAAIIYERYRTKAALEEVHNAGAEFQAFGKRLGEGDLKGLVVAKSKRFFHESNVGYMTK